jgi:hypothetical protein
MSRKKDNDPGHERGKVSGGRARGKDSDPDRDKATVHTHNYNITRADGTKECACGETQ